MATSTTERTSGTNTPPTEDPSDIDKALSSVGSGLRKLPTSLNFWVPLVSSILALILSLYSLIVSTQEPEVLLILPNRIYLSEAFEDPNIYHPGAVYLQPNLISTGNNSRNELIRDMTLRIEPESGGEPLTLRWREQGAWDFTDVMGEMVRGYSYTADAAPMLINPNQAQQPLSLFPIETNWTLQPDQPYRLTLTANRAVASTPLVARATMAVTAQQIDEMKSQTRQTIMAVPITPLIGP